MSLEAQALFAPSGTEISIKVTAPVLPEVLDKVQVKGWPPGADEAETWNFRDVPYKEGRATLSLTGLERGERLEVRAHIKDGPTQTLETETTVLRRPDLTVTQIDLPDDVVRTHEAAIAVTIGEVGGDVGATARVELFDGPTAIAHMPVDVNAGEAAIANFVFAFVRPGQHTLRAVVSASDPAEWDEAPNDAAQGLYVNHYTANGVVATDHPLATQVGVEVLRNGGNAFDAAAAVQFALNVTQPHLSGIGGGSNVLVRLSSGEMFAIDARETAPAATTPTTYAGRTAAQVRPNGYAVGVPGTLRAVEYLVDRWGTKTLEEALEPAIALAENGFPVGRLLATNIAGQRSVFQPETSAILLNDSGQPLAQGDLIFQKDIAKTFRLLARDGASVFYEGEIADAIVAAQQRATTPGREGLMTRADLAAYSIDVESPLSLDFRGYEVLAPPPSTNGGVMLLESLGLIREFLADPRNAGYAWGFGTRNALHIFIEAIRLAAADRNLWIGDERYSNVPAPLLLNDDYLRDRSKLINGETVICNLPSTTPATPPAGNPFAYTTPVAPSVESGISETGHTTHFSIIDRWGNAVVMTSTLADSFGTGITVPGYGFLLNDSLNLFNLQPLADPVKGNPGANDAAGGKRPMGSMTPTLILKGGEPFAGTGSFAAAFIPSIVLNVVLNLLEFEKPLQAAVEAPRVYIATAAGAAAVNVGFAHLIDPLRTMGHIAPVFGGCADNLNRTPGGPTSIGSTGSFGVDLTDFSLVAGEDSARQADAKTTIVTRP